MKIIILALFLSLLAFGQAQLIPPSQDHPSLNWKKLENDHFKILYPDFLEERAKYILNLLEYFRDKVGESYSAVPKKFTLVIRSQMSEPNGFVGLAPRRSEWFSSMALTPMVGSLDWYQALAVHEYRHVVQMDYLNRPHINLGYTFFGELGQTVLMNWVTPGWYFEGDAVYTETKYTDAGRGRSPRFLARMKALASSDNIPTYDQFLAGDYTNSIPNHYVYGYLLISRAYRKYGDNIWAEIMSRTARKVWNPWAIYNAFEAATSMSFENFYRETMDELRQMWGTEIPKQKELYSRVDYPLVDDGKLFYLKQSLDSFWTLNSNNNGDEKKLAEFNIAPSLSRVDLKNGKFVYTISFSHPRYMYKGHSDIYLYDIKHDDTKQVTDGERLYHPQLHPFKSEIMAVEFDNKNIWSLSFYDFDGNRTDSIRLTGQAISEAIYLDDGNIAVILIDPLGMKSIAKMNRSTHEFEILVGPGRNNFYSLAKGEGSVLFEADFEGKVNIFEINFNNKNIRQCSFEEIAAYRPHIAHNKLYYSSEVANGSELKEVRYECGPLSKSALSFYAYLGKGPSDNYVDSVPRPIDLTKNERSKVDVASESYDSLEGALRPHSWSFIGRGFQLGATAQNMLSTLFWSGAVGYSGVESRPYADFNIGYAKYFPIFAVNVNYADRKIQYNEKQSSISTWSEAQVGVSMSIPLVFQRNLFTQNINFTLNASNLSVSNKEDYESYEPSDEQLQVTGAVISVANTKEKTYRELIPSWGQTLTLLYQNANANEDENFSSHMSFANSNFYFPGLIHNHGLKVSGTLESHKDSINSYRFDSPAASPTGYIYSRGYIQDYFPKYSKVTVDYYFPVAYPNAGFRDYFYFNRIYANVFYDATILDGKMDDYNFRSFGGEFHFESLTFRKLPLVYSFRFYKKLDEDGEKSGGADFYLGTIFDL